MGPMANKLIFLGTGTSHGVPVMGCDCAVCRSHDPRDQRYRCAAYVEYRGSRVVVDTPPEFRLQCLRENIRYLDAVLYTHSHADHIKGLDDLRRFNELQGTSLPAYANGTTADEIESSFPYIFRPPMQRGGGLPRLTIRRTEEYSLPGGIIPVTVEHGKMNILGYRFGPLAYITDASSITKGSADLLAGVEVLIINALRYRSHPTHFNVEQALAWIDRLRPQRAYLTHICHDLCHAKLDASLPDHVSPAYDGLALSF